MQRFWPSALEAWSSFADEIIVLDDGSTDGTYEYAQDYALVERRTDIPAWGAEASARQELFELAWGVTAVGDYIIWLDADMVPARNPRILMDAGTDGVLFCLYDLWRQDRRLWYREDRFWRGHHHARLWMVRRTARRDFEWNTRGIHTGHLPVDFPCESYAYAPMDYSLLHYAYINEELRQEKYERYMSVKDELTDFEKEHAATILDEQPHLVHLTPQPELTLCELV